MAVLASHSATSALTTAVDAWIKSGETIMVEDQAFTVYLSSKTNEIMADYGKSGLFIKNNTCDSAGIAKVCLDNIQYDQATKTYKLKVRGISLAPSITLTREATKSELLVGEEVTFSVTLTNTGGIARNITYEELIPPQFEITSAEGIKLQSDKATWKGSLDTDESKTVSYKFKAKTTFEGSMVPSLKYSDGLKMKTTYGLKKDLKAKPAVILETIIGDSTTLLGEKDNLTVNLTNRLPEAAIVTVDLLFDPGLKVTSVPRGVKEIGPLHYFWTDQIDRVYNRTTNTTNLSNAWINQSRSWFFGFKGIRVGSSGMTAKVTYKGKSESTARTLPDSRQSVVVSNNGVIIRTSLKDSTFESNQRKRMKVWLQNLNPHVKIRNIYVNSSTDLLILPDAYLDSLEPNEQVLLIDKYFYAPDVEASTGYSVLNNVTYLTEFGDNFTASFKDTATVSPMQAVSIAQSISSSSAKPDEDVDVMVTAKNARLTDLKNVMVSDNVSSEFFVIGKNSAVLEIKSKASEKAYAYKLRVPHAKASTVLYVNSTLKYSESQSSDTYLEPKEYTISQVSTITVKQDELPLTITRTISSNPVYSGENFDVNYLITNTATGKSAFNIKLAIPLDDSDLVDSNEPVYIPQLEPGESIAVTNSEKRRGKKTGELELDAATLSYENSYGDIFHVNSTKSTVTIKENYISGPMINLDKSAPASANNTQDFSISLNISNTGNSPSEVKVEDGSREFLITVANNTVYTINYTTRITTSGKARLKAAKATYSNNGYTYRTASDEPEIEILETPILIAEKTAPAKATEGENFTVTISLSNNAEKAIKNVTVSEGSRAWKIEAIKAFTSTSIAYNETKTAGSQTLETASVTYTYEGNLYSTKSNLQTIEIEKKEEPQIAETGITLQQEQNQTSNETSQENAPEAKKESAIKSFLKGLLSLLSWKRGG